VNKSGCEEKHKLVEYLFIYLFIYYITRIYSFDEYHQFQNHCDVCGRWCRSRWRRHSSVVMKSVFGRRTFPAMRPIYGWGWPMTFVCAIQGNSAFHPSPVGKWAVIYVRTWITELETIYSNCDSDSLVVKLQATWSNYYYYCVLQRKASTSWHRTTIDWKLRFNGVKSSLVDSKSVEFCLHKTDQHCRMISNLGLLRDTYEAE